MNIDLSDEHFKGLVAEAIVLKLSDERKDTLIAAALTHLLTPPKKQQSWDEQEPAPLQRMFNEEIVRQARMTLENLMSDPNSELHKRINELIAEAVAKFVTRDYAGIADKMADSLSRGLKKTNERDDC